MNKSIRIVVVLSSLLLMFMTMNGENSNNPGCYNIKNRNERHHITIVKGTHHNIYINGFFLDGLSTGNIKSFPSIHSEENDDDVFCNAGDDIISCKNSLITLDGSNSRDKKSGSQLIYFWFFAAKPPGSNAKLKNEKTENPSFTIDVSGEYYVTLQVSTPDGRKGSDTIKVEGKECDSFPVAVIDYSPQYCGLPAIIELSGKASYVGIQQEEIIDFEWKIEKQPVESHAYLSSNGFETTSIFAEHPGDYIISLRVRTVSNSSEPARARIIVNEGSPPTILPMIKRERINSFLIEKDVVLIDYLFVSGGECRAAIDTFILYRKGAGDYEHLKTIDVSEMKIMGENSAEYSFMDVYLSPEASYYYLLVGIDEYNQVSVFNEVKI